MAKHNLKATVLGYEYTWTVDMEASTLVIEAARKGFQEWLQDAASTAKPRDDHPEDTDEDGKVIKAVRHLRMNERFAKIRDGSYRPGQGGGGGSRQSPVDKGWIAYFNAIQHKEGGNPVNGKTLRRAQETLARQWILDQYTAGTPERDQVARNMKDHITEKFDDFLKDKEANDPVVKAMIDAQKAIKAAEQLAQQMG